MKFIKKLSKYIIVTLIICLLIILFLPSRTPKISGYNSVATIQQVKIGGFQQSIMIRGKDKSNPILLFLHGGPGYSQISYARKYQEKLEQDFLVVNWDQRGSGKSYSRSIPKESMNREQFVKDTKELIDFLCKKYDKEKVYLVGHSWGSELGMFVIDKYPEKIFAFISVGQVVNGIQNEIISYDYVLQKAKENGDKKVLDDLRRIERPPYKDSVNDTTVQRKWLSKYGGVERKVNTLNDIILGSVFSPEYTGIDGIKFALGSKFTAEAMWGQNYDLNLKEDIPEVKVPIYFCVGRYDYNTPFVLTEEYYDKIKAPNKELIWFEKSAHFPLFEEPDKFADIIIDIKDNIQ
ncbi:alpha/beta hydrolase [Clostridium sp. D2Q-11]|uniref:Alpha/beta hydrolase n=1 Tax=Anaeromonas frigoriresistens TaxID=2683708 RepID=A0A942URY7_9FIRM|nr:alpha/beta hydrolase [Anaeromonas frigoriresistens]MBS4537493.1 alpha/beta hydrolase [Anaeromonas frigoriresistens]